MGWASWWVMGRTPATLPVEKESAVVGAHPAALHRATGSPAITTTYVGPCLAAAGEDGGETFALRRWLEALPSLDLGQQLRVVTGGGHHVEGLGAWREAGWAVRVPLPAAPDALGALQAGRAQGGWLIAPPQLGPPESPIRAASLIPPHCKSSDLPVEGPAHGWSSPVGQTRATSPGSWTPCSPQQQCAGSLSRPHAIPKGCTAPEHSIAAGNAHTLRAPTVRASHERVPNGPWCCAKAEPPSRCPRLAPLGGLRVLRALPSSTAETPRPREPALIKHGGAAGAHVVGSRRPAERKQRLSVCGAPALPALPGGFGSPAPSFGSRVASPGDAMARAQWAPALLAVAGPIGHRCPMALAWDGARLAPSGTPEQGGAQGCGTYSSSA